MKLPPLTLSQVDAALKEYCQVVLTSDLSAASQASYIDHADNFVRWLRGEFNPGARANPYPLKRRRAS